MNGCPEDGWCPQAEMPCTEPWFCIERDGEEAGEELFGGVRFCPACAERWKVEPCPVFHGADEACPFE